MKKTGKELPSYLVSTHCMLMSAFPDRVPEKHLETIAVILGERLSCRNIAKVLEAGECVAEGDGYYFAMAALAGGHLEQNRQQKEAMVRLLC